MLSVVVSSCRKIEVLGVLCPEEENGSTPSSLYFFYSFIYLFIESCSMLFGVEKGIVNIACYEDIVLRVIC